MLFSQLALNTIAVNGQNSGNTAFSGTLSLSAVSAVPEHLGNDVVGLRRGWFLDGSPWFEPDTGRLAGDLAIVIVESSIRNVGLSSFSP